MRKYTLMLAVLMALPQTGRSQQPDLGPTPYTGEIVTFNLVGSDIRDFFRTIAELSGLNLIVDDAVTGEVTLILNDVPWDQALDLVLRSNALGYELIGNVLRIAPRSVLLAEAQAEQELERTRALEGPLETRVFVLNYANAEAANAIIETLLSERGTSMVDPRRNALIVTDVANRLARIGAAVGP